MDSILKKKFVRQDLQDLLDILLALAVSGRNSQNQSPSANIRIEVNNYVQN
jgi:hypothetical protein